MLFLKKVTQKFDTFSVKVTMNWENCHSWISHFTQMVKSEITFTLNSRKFWSRPITSCYANDSLNLCLLTVISAVVRTMSWCHRRCQPYQGSKIPDKVLDPEWQKSFFIFSRKKKYWNLKFWPNFSHCQIIKNVILPFYTNHHDIDQLITWSWSTKLVLLILP